MLEAELAFTANPASVHAAGRAARAALERARDRVAGAVAGAPSEIVFTSGGTEACNLGVLGLLAAAPPGARVLSSAVEHPAVDEPLRWLEARDRVRVERLGVPAGVPPTAEALAERIDSDTVLVAIQWVNHETGTRFPIEAYAQVCQRARVPLFVDATQALGKLPLDLPGSGVSAAALAGAKLGGPGGAGALWVRRGVDLAPQLHGGGQERGRRPGSPGVAALVGFGAACAQVPGRLAAQLRIAALRDRLEGLLAAAGARVNADRGPRVGTVTNVSLAGCRGAHLVAALDLEGVCCSSGAACSSGVDRPSPVLLAMYPDEAWRAESAIRFSFGPENTEIDVDFANTALAKIRSRSASGAARE